MSAQDIRPNGYLGISIVCNFSNENGAIVHQEFVEIVFLVLVFVFILALVKNPHFPEFLAFAGNLIGGVMAFYFNNRSNS